jgi:hypothetical protein
MGLFSWLFGRRSTTPTYRRRLNNVPNNRNHLMSMNDPRNPSNPYGWTNMHSLNNPHGWRHPASPNNPQNRMRRR